MRFDQRKIYAAKGISFVAVMPEDVFALAEPTLDDNGAARLPFYNIWCLFLFFSFLLVLTNVSLGGETHGFRPGPSGSIFECVLHHFIHV
jgi:hypothetical protein